MKRNYEKENRLLHQKLSESNELLIAYQALYMDSLEELDKLKNGDKEESK